MDDPGLHGGVWAAIGAFFTEGVRFVVSLFKSRKQNRHQKEQLEISEVRLMVAGYKGIIAELKERIDDFKEEMKEKLAQHSVQIQRLTEEHKKCQDENTVLRRKVERLEGAHSGEPLT